MTDGPDARGDRTRTWAPAAAVALAAFVLYALTLYPDVAGGDAGEIVAAVAGGGVIHPPGYPLYCLLGRLFLHLPHGTVAWRLNLLSAACDAGAAGVLTAAVQRWSKSTAGGVVAGALFASSPGVWRYAISAEVFALDNLMVATLFLVAVLYAEKRDERIALAGATALGLGLSDHQTVLFSGIPFAAWILWAGRDTLLRPGPLARLVGAGALGLLPYLYLPFAAAHHAPVTWGEADTWHGFWTHVLRREYGTFQLAPNGIAPSSSSTETLVAWGRDLREQIGLWGVPLAGAGVYASLQPPRAARLGEAVLAAAGLSAGVMILLGNLPSSDALHAGIVARFWQQPDLYVCGWCGLGVAWLEGRRTDPVPAWAFTAAVGALAVLPAALRFHSMDRSASTAVRSYGEAILRAAPPGALLVTRGDLITNTARYLQTQEGARPDVIVADQELLGFAWYARLVAAEHPELVLPGPRYMPGDPDSFTMKQLFDDNLTRAPVLVCGGSKPGDSTANGTYGRWPLGLCERIRRGDQPVDVDEWLAQSDAALPRIDFSHEIHPPGSWEDIVWTDMWEVRATRAAHLIEIAGADPAHRPWLALAADLLEQLLREHPAMGPHVYKNLAIAIGRAGLDSPEQRARAAKAWKAYLAVAPPEDPMLPGIRKELERLTTASP